MNVGMLVDDLNGVDIEETSDRWNLFWQAPTVSADALFDAVTVGSVRNVRSNNPRNFARLIGHVRSTFDSLFLLFVFVFVVVEWFNIHI